MSLLSPGVEIQEINASVIVPSVSNSVACFAGDFVRGPVESYLLISNEDELVTYYGKSTKSNFNDWMQASSFLQYGDQLLISRAANTDGSTSIISGVTVSADTSSDVIPISGTIESIEVGDYVAFGDVNGVILEKYLVLAVDIAGSTITLDRAATIVVADDDTVYSIARTDNAVFDAVEVGGTPILDNDYIRTQFPILNYSDFEIKESAIVMNSTESKLKIISRDPGLWGNDIEVAIALPTDFNADKYVFEGIALDDLFEYFPSGSEVGIVIRYEGVIKEIFTVSFDPNDLNDSNKSIYIEDVINRQSSYIFVKDNTANTNDIDSYIFSSLKGVISLVQGTDSPIGINDLARAYDIWSNKEEVDIDVIIANELDDAAGGKALVDSRKDCLLFIGAKREDTVGLKSAVILQNLIDWRTTGPLNFNDMFCVATGNYLYMYNKYLDAYKWINCAGTTAGLRCQTNANRDAWWASAGLERGQILGVSKLAFNPNVSARDQMYKRGLNPIVSFAGQGIVMWGQKTLLDKPSSSNNSSFIKLAA